MAHGEDLHAETQDRELVEALKDDYRKAPLSPAERALLDYAYGLTVEPEGPTRDHLEHLRSFGFDEKAMLEIVQIIAYFNYINRVAQALGVDPEPEWVDSKVSGLGIQS